MAQTLYNPAQLQTLDELPLAWCFERQLYLTLVLNENPVGGLGSRLGCPLGPFKDRVRESALVKRLRYERALLEAACSRPVDYLGEEFFVVRHTVNTNWWPAARLKEGGHVFEDGHPYPWQIKFYAWLRAFGNEPLALLQEMWDNWLDPTTTPERQKRHLLGLVLTYPYHTFSKVAHHFDVLLSKMYNNRHTWSDCKALLAE